MKFAKYEGLGNDFIIVEGPELGPLGAPGWHVVIIFIALVVFMPGHCYTVFFVRVNRHFNKPKDPFTQNRACRLILGVQVAISMVP